MTETVIIPGKKYNLTFKTEKDEIYAYIIYRFFLINFTNLLAQETIVPLEDKHTINTSNGDYYFKDVNNHLDKFTGEWIYSDSNIYLKLLITKKTHQDMGRGFFATNDYRDLIVVSMQYKENGIEKYNTFPFIINGEGSRMTGYRLNSIDKIEIIYSEPSLISCERFMRGDLFLELLSGNPKQLKWTRIDGTPHYGLKNICPNGVLDDTPFLIPANLVLTKQ